MGGTAGVCRRQQPDDTHSGGRQREDAAAELGAARKRADGARLTPLAKPWRQACSVGEPAIRCATWSVSSARWSLHEK
jgi:hypothetical protein